MGKKFSAYNNQANPEGGAKLLYENLAATDSYYQTFDQFLAAKVITTEVLAISVDGQVSFTLSQTPPSPSVAMLFLNGQLREYGVTKDYTISGTTLTWNDPGGLTLLTTDLLQIWYNVNLGGSFWQRNGSILSSLITGDSLRIGDIDIDSNFISTYTNNPLNLIPNTDNLLVLKTVASALPNTRINAIKEDGVLNAVSNIMAYYHIFGTPSAGQNGVGASIEFYAPNNSPASTLLLGIETSFTSVFAGFEKSKVDFKIHKSGTPTIVLSFDEDKLDLKDLGLADTNVTTPVTLGEVGETSFDTTSQSIVGALNEVNAKFPTQKSIFRMSTDYNANLGNMRTRDVTATGEHRFTFGILPDDFVSLVEAYLIGYVSAGATGASKDIDISSDYNGDGEVYNTHSESDTTTLYDFTGLTNQRKRIIPLSGILTSLSAGDSFSIYVDHNGIGGAIDYIGIELIYNT
jgi:hypothetical protein